MGDATQRAPRAAQPTASSIARRNAFELARRDWSEVALGFDQYCEYLEQLGYPDGLPEHFSSVYLCAGCAAGLAPAQRTLERRFFPALRAPVYRLVGESDLVDDTLQDVLHRLLAETSPKIRTYQGRGPFASWLRSIAVNAALDQRRANVARYKRQRMHAEALRLLVGGSLDGGSPEDRVSQKHVALSCERSLLSAVNELKSEDRRLLRAYFVLGLSIDVLGELYGIDRSTAARRIQRALKRIRIKIQREQCPGSSRSSADMVALAKLLGECVEIDAGALLAP